MAAPFYSRTVEHYFRLAIGQSKIPNNAHLAKWYNKVNEWMSALPETDAAFLKAVFSRRNTSVQVVLQLIPGNTLENWDRLNRLEKSFAVYAELY